MTKGSEGDKPSPNDHKEAKNASGEKSQVARTKLDINMDDLIDPLHGQTQDSDQAGAPHVDLQKAEPKYGESKVAKTMLEKTMLETDGPTLKQIKDLSDADVDSLSAEDFKALKKELAKTLPESATLKNREQVEKSIQDEAAEARKRKIETEKAKTDKKSLKATPEKAHLSKLAKTLPEVEIGKKKSESGVNQAEDQQEKSSLKKLATTIPESEAREQSQGKDGEEETVSIKELAKTIPDPPMQERIAVSKRIARIRKFQKTAQVKSVKFSKTMTQASIEIVDSVQKGAQNLTPESSSESSQKSSSENLQQSSQWKSPSESSPKKKPYVQEQFVAKTQLDHDILFRAVSTSKLKEEAKVAAFLIEKSKEAPKPPPVAVKADKQSSACPFKWEETDSKEKYRYCTKCQTPVYNFDGMERPEAEALIFNRENRDKFTLYSRPDGKFTTVDCPLQKKRQRDFIMGLIVAVALLIGALSLFLLTPPPPPPATVETSPGGSRGSSTTESTAENSGEASTESETPSDVRTFSSLAKERPTARKKESTGSGAGLQTFQLPSGSQRSAKAPDPDEDGSFWKF